MPWRRIFDLLSAASILSACISLVPTSAFWFSPSSVSYHDGIVTVQRTIKRDFIGSYTVVLRDVATGQVTKDNGAEGFPYKKAASVKPLVRPLGEFMGLGDYMPPPGLYELNVCWQADIRLLGIFRPRRVCIDSLPFEVTE